MLFSNHGRHSLYPFLPLGGNGARGWIKMSFSFAAGALKGLKKCGDSPPLLGLIRSLRLPLSDST